MELFETPPPEPTRRNTRRALTEIPGSTLDNQVVTGRATILMTTVPVTRTPINSMLSYVTPSPSPDEIVIQARGRRRMPDTWSPPDLRYSPSYRNRSPVKDLTPNKIGSAIVTRSTPRKRLLMGDTPPDVTLSPECKSLSPMLKKLRLEPSSPLHGGQGEPFAGLRLKALSRDQLIEVIEGLARKHSIVQDELRHNLPLPDMRPITEKLYDLKRNIFKSLPASRLSSKSDGSAYSRAATHVHAFKKAVLEAGKNYVASQEWDTVFRYALMAWSQTTSTPIWDNIPHNAPRRHCYRYLAGLMQQALKKMGRLPEEEIESIQTKFKKFSTESEDILPCLKILEEMKEQIQ